MAAFINRRDAKIAEIGNVKMLSRVWCSQRLDDRVELGLYSFGGPLRRTRQQPVLSMLGRPSDAA
jgi:hypothetical protein